MTKQCRALFTKTTHCRYGWREQSTCLSRCSSTTMPLSSSWQDEGKREIQSSPSSASNHVTNSLTRETIVCVWPRDHRKNVEMIFPSVALPIMAMSRQIPNVSKRVKLVPRISRTIEWNLTWILFEFFMFSSCGMVFVTTTASNGELFILDMAGPLKMPWVQIAYTLLAPALNNLDKTMAK